MRNDSTPLSILITDDLAQNRVYFSQIIRSMLINTQIYEADNGENAVKLASLQITQTGSSFDIIIMDFKMPGLNGQQATFAIRQLERAANLTQSSIIITWSSSMHAPYEEADDWLPKIFRKEDFIRILQPHNLL